MCCVFWIIFFLAVVRFRYIVAGESSSIFFSHLNLAQPIKSLIINCPSILNYDIIARIPSVDEAVIILVILFIFYSIWWYVIMPMPISQKTFIDDSIASGLFEKIIFRLNAGDSVVIKRLSKMGSMNMPTVHSFDHE